MIDRFLLKNIGRKGKPPRLPFRRMKNRVLGKNYELSLTIFTPTQSKKLNLSYRKINSPSDILSFPLTSSSGEIFIDPETAAKEAVKFNQTPEKFLGFLFIHGLLHLKGFGHGKKMESLEKKYCQEFHL